MFRKRNLLAIVPALVLLLVLGTTVLAQETVTVQTADNPTYGQILTDTQGKTLYMFANDTAGVSNCTGNCATNWPPLTVSAGITPTLASGVTGNLTTLQRDDGTTQVAFNDMPLYYFVQDQAAGDTLGQGVGGNWWVINPATGPVMQAAEPTATPEAVATAAPEAAAAAATPAPGTLPTTGADNGVVLALLLGGALLLLALGGMSLVAVRQKR